MNATKLHIQGTEINKIQFSEIEQYLEEKGLNVDSIFAMIADEKEFIYVSNGFVAGLKKEENENGEWHHYFVNEGGYFSAGKMMFN